MATRTYNWLSEPPQAYQRNFLPPHTDQFYATDVPMYYDEAHRFNIDRALSKKGILEQSSSYPYLDTSKVVFADTDVGRRAHYDHYTDESVLNLKNIDPQNLDERDLKTIDHETIHRTLSPVHGIPAAAQLLKGSIEPFDSEFNYYQDGPKRATDYRPYENIKDTYKNEHLLLDAIQNLDHPEFDESQLDQSLYQNFDQYPYHTALLDEVSEGLFGGGYYAPKSPFLGNAPGEVRRGYFGLRDLFDRTARKYKNIMKNYANRKQGGPRAATRRAPAERLGDAGVAEAIATQDRAKKNAAIQEAVNRQIGTSRGGAFVKAPPKTITPRHAPHPDRGGGSQPGSMPTNTAGKNPWGRAHGGLIDIPLPGRSRDI